MVRDRLERMLDLRGGEGGKVLLAAAYHFFLMAAYFVLKPLRDEMGVRSGARDLEWLWLGTFVTSLLVLPPYWKLVATLPRRRFIPIVYRFVLATLVLYFVLFRSLPDAWQIWAARSFFVWVSVFNLFVLTVFWSFMADSFTPEQGRRLFGFVAAGGTTGALLGAWLTKEFASELRTIGLLLVSAGLLEVATQCALALGRHAPPRETVVAATARPSLLGQWIAGFRLLARSPYLLGAAGYLFLSTLAASFAYPIRTEIMGTELRDSATRTAVFAWSDLVTQGGAFVGQTLLAARLLRSIGTGATLAVQMTFAAGGFVLLAALLGGDGAAAAPEGTTWWRWIGLPISSPSVALLAVVLFFPALKAIEYALSKPARESLYTVVTRDEKYQSKSLIDTGLYRGFDQIQIVAFSRLHYTLGWSAAACSGAIAPLLLGGVGLSFWLGRRQAELASVRAAAVEATPPALEPAAAGAPTARPPS